MPKFSFHCQHYKAGQINALDKHNRRLNKNYISNPDIDISRTIQNRVYIQPKGTLYQDCKKRIQNEVLQHNGRVTKISNWITECIFSYPEGLPLDDMDEYFQLIIDFMGFKLGIDNIREAVAHLDEGGLPHLHLDITPITSQHKLTSKNIFTRDFILSIHNELPIVLQQYGFNVKRGQEQTKKGHAGLSAKEYKRAMSKEAKAIDEQLNQMIDEYNLLAEKYNQLKADSVALSRGNQRKAEEILNYRERCL